MGAARLENLPHYTYEEYENWEGRWELIDGIPYAMSPSPVYAHQDISANISYELKSRLKNCKFCKAVLAVDWIISNDTVVCPDNMVSCTKGIKTKFIEKTPEVIFEILSPSTKKKDRTTKYNLFQEKGVKYYILVDPKGSFAELYILKDGYYKLEAEFSNETFNFELDECSFKFNFGNIFD
ncbi:MAG: Uma2 family endonuclease [Helicobacteraceae bacterium]|nr:Uma2 family endonuclease [Helicobacteraceae bacterium]